MAKRVLELKNNQAQVKGDSQILIYKDAESDVSMSEGDDDDEAHLHKTVEGVVFINICYFLSC